MKTLNSFVATANSLKALLFVMLWVGAVYACALPALAASLSVSPATGVYTAGATFSVGVVVNTDGQSINAAEGTLSFNPNELSVVSISKGSMFNLWTAEPTFSNSAGTISFGGGSPSGFSGSRGTVMTVTFRAKGAGNPRVSFTGGSILAADGRGTNVLTNMGNGSYTISSAEVTPEPEVIEYVAPANTPATPVVRSSTHPDPAGWYREKTAQLTWQLPSGITGVRTLLDGNSGSIPTKVYEQPISSIELPDLSEGVSYFHIQFRNSDGWGRVAHYRLAVDSQKPESFEITLPENADLSNPEQILLLNVKDATSPVRRFAVQLDGAEPYEYVDETGSSTITLPALAPGRHSVIIEAFDAAGNSVISTFAFDILSFDKPVFTEYPSELNEGVIPVIKGLTRPRSKVTLTVEKVGSEPTQHELTADEGGVFTYIPEASFSSGVYELTAVATDEHGAQSDPSDPIRIAVQQPGYIQIGSFIVSVLSVIVPLVALVILLGLLGWYGLYRWRRLRHTVAVESDEAVASVKTEFDRLASLLKEEKDALVNSRKTKKLTKAEEALIETIGQALTEARSRVSKEVSDIEDLVNSK